MTLLQLKYAITVAETGTISEAAKSLYLAQPSLTGAIRELEKEVGISIFRRTNRGITVTKQGEEFLGYARQVLEQMSLLEEKYKGQRPGRRSFSVSTQHYAFAVEAFVELLRTADPEEYDFSLRETQTYEIIADVAKLHSEVGILYLNRFNEVILRKALRENDLVFTPLITARPHVFLSAWHPLAKQVSVTPEQLEDYPYLSFEQGEHNSFHFSEEILSTQVRKKNIRVRDRATLSNLILGLNGYTISSGMISETLNGRNIVSVPLQVDDSMEIGYIVHNKVILSRMGRQYIEELKKQVQVFRESDQF